MMRFGRRHGRRIWRDGWELDRTRGVAARVDVQEEVGEEA